MFSFIRHAGLCIVLILFTAPAWSQDPATRDDPEIQVEDINEGELNFLEKLPARPVHHHQTTLLFLPESIKTGWVTLLQCHEHLDPFPRAQIVYHKNKTRNLKLTFQQNIGEARVEGVTVQLTDVRKNARLCIQVQSRALIPQSDRPSSAPRGWPWPCRCRR